MKTKIMIVDDNEEFLSQAKDHFENSAQTEVVFYAKNGQEALDFLAQNQVDLVLLDLVMPLVDGFEVLQKTQKSNHKTIVLSALSQDIFIAKAMQSGADYYMIKPAAFAKIEEKIAEIAKKPTRSARPNKGMEEKITNIFITVGIPAHIKGYQFLREAIKMAIDNPDIINAITKRLYPSVAQRFETSASKVERAIRHAIEVAWNRGKIENINTLFGVRVYSQNEKPTNGEFIALVADKMLLESV